MQVIGNYIVVPEGNGDCLGSAPCDGQAVFSVTVTFEGTVELECQVKADSNSKSFNIWFDDDAVYEWHTLEYSTFSWLAVQHTWTLSAGFHTLHIGVREDGTKMKALRIVSGGNAFFGSPSTGTLCTAVHSVVLLKKLRLQRTTHHTAPC